MFKYFSHSLKRRLTVLFLLVAIVPVTAVAFIAHVYSSRALEKDALDKLTAVRETKRNQLVQYLDQRLSDASILAWSDNVRDAIAELEGRDGSGAEGVDGKYDVESPEHSRIREHIDPFFHEYVRNYGYDDLFLICNDHGHVMYSVARKRDTGTSLKTGAYRDSNLARLWEKVRAKGETCMVDFAEYEPSGKPAGFVGAPILDAAGTFLGVLALQINIDQIDAVMQARTGLGESGETYLVGEDLLMRSDSRFESASTILKKKVDTVTVRQALEDRSGTGIVEDYEGVEVLDSYTHLGLDEELGLDFEWVLLAEIDASEAFAPATRLRSKIVWAGLLLAAISCVVGYLSARSISRPLEVLLAGAARMAKGDLTVEVQALEREDEVGLLTRAFQSMLETLRDQILQIREGVTTMACSISEISSTASELAASAAETATSISEITTTVEEVKQTSQLSSDKAGSVATKTGAVAEITSVGTKATQQTVVGINRIKDEMDCIADSIVKLSDQTQSIGKIIGAVNDLADQSNLLSVNASIEAAKAGEFGKGFAVVAQEVRALADQSKGATEQVRTILRDIEKATGAVVMATERGTKAVMTGSELSSKAGDAIGQLSAGVSDAALAVKQIAASNREQLVGIDQLASAMENISEATTQNLEGARQLEAAAGSLNALGQRLTELTGSFNA